MENNDYIEFEGVRRYQPDALHKRMLAKIAELETQLQAAQQWQPIMADEEHSGHYKTIRIENEGRWIELEYDDNRIGAWLDSIGCAVLRKVQPE